MLTGEDITRITDTISAVEQLDTHGIALEVTALAVRRNNMVKLGVSKFLRVGILAEC
jgi:hypothetical protein